MSGDRVFGYDDELADNTRRILAIRHVFIYLNEAVMVPNCVHNAKPIFRKI